MYKYVEFITFYNFSNVKIKFPLILFFYLKTNIHFDESFFFLHQIETNLSE